MTQTQPDRTHPQPERTRTYSWADTTDVDFARLIQLTGLEQLETMIKGEAPRPPVMDLLDMESFAAEHGRVVVTMRAKEFHYNPLGGVHGGVIATLLDTAAACSVHSTLAVGETYTSLDLNTKFLRPVTIGSGLLTCEGTIIQRGRRTALAQAQLTDEGGRLVAHATSSCLIFPLG